ncbi:hypothetical protein GYMLUDRAFT_213321 [Collybiopsis luxurians FD-317 M1]|nr:hypothetical protein GYMLUDRAFT_213321 [Collybiopsis luxurians FD-317 M1]
MKQTIDKKQRLQNACDFCKKKKIRCDSAIAKNPGNTCSNCLKENINCTHTAQRKKRGPRTGSSRKNTTSVKAIISAIIAQPDTYAIPDDPNAVREMLLSLAYHVRSLEGQVSRWRQAVKDNQASQSSGFLNSVHNTDSFSEDSDSDVSEDVDEEIMLGGLKAITLEKSADIWPKHYGRSSNMVMLQTAVKLKKEVFGHKGDSQFPSLEYWELRKYQRPEFWQRYQWEREEEPHPPLVFPEDDLLQSLSDLYFLHAHPYFPILHRPSFEKAIFRGLHLRNRKFGNVVLGVCAIASRFSEDPRVLVEGAQRNLRSSGWRWFKQASPIRTSMVQPPTLEDLQSCCLSSLYLVATPLSDLMFAIIGLGIRFAQDMGLHRKKKLRPNGESNLRTVCGELCTRTFWMLMNLDIYASIAFGRPRATTDDDFDLELPMEIDDEYWENANPEQPADAPSKISFFLYHCKIMEIAGFVQRALYSVNRSAFWKKLAPTGPDWQQKVVTEIDSALNQWLSSLPEYLKWDSKKQDSIFLRQSAALYTAFYWTQILAHGQFVRPGPNGSGQQSLLSGPALTICAHAARCVVSIMEVQQRFQFELPVLLTAPVYTSAIILLICGWTKSSTPRTLEASKDLQNSHRCIDILAIHEQRYQIAGRLNDILRSIIYLGNRHFVADSSGGQSTSMRADKLPANSIPILNTSKSNIASSVVAGMESHTGSMSSHIPTDTYSNPVNPTALDDIVLDSELYNYSSTGHEGWPMDIESASLASETEANWSFFMAEVDGILQSVDAEVVNQSLLAY